MGAAGESKAQTLLPHQSQETSAGNKPFFDFFFLNPFFFGPFSFCAKVASPILFKKISRSSRT